MLLAKLKYQILSNWLRGHGDNYDLVIFGPF